MATPGQQPKPDWMSQEQYDEYLVNYAFDPVMGDNIFQKMQATQNRLEQRIQLTQQPTPVQPPLPPAPAEDTAAGQQVQQQLQQAADIPTQEVIPLQFPGQIQFMTGTGMYRRLIPADVDKAQRTEYEEVVKDLIDAGYPSEAEVLQEVEADLVANGYLPFSLDAEERRAYEDAKAEELSYLEWAEKIAYQDLFSDYKSPRRPRAASEFSTPAPSIGSSELTRKTPEEIAEMGTLEVMIEAAKPQVLETQAMKERRKATEAMYESFDREAKLREEAGEDYDVAYNDITTKFFGNKQNQALQQARANYSQFTGVPIEEATNEQINMLARDIYLQFLNNDFPEEYRNETRQTDPDRAAFGIISDQEGMFFTVWGDAIHRGFLTNEVDVTGLRSVMYDVGILEEPDLITETMAGALVRDIGGLVRIPINPVKEMLTYSVDPYSGKPLDPNDWGLFEVQEMGRKEDAAWGKTIRLPAETGMVEDYFKTTAYEIATMRTLGDDLASLSVVPEDYETAVRVGGLVGELLIPISPKLWTTPIVATAKGATKLPSRASKLAKGRQLKAVETAITEQTDVLTATRQLASDARVAGRADEAAELTRTANQLSDELISLDAQRLKLEKSIKGSEDFMQQVDFFAESPLQSIYTPMLRRKHLDKPLKGAINSTDETIGLSTRDLLDLPADEVVRSQTFAARYADQVGVLMEDMIDLSLGATTPGANRLRAMNMTEVGAKEFINAMASQQKGTIAQKLGSAAQAEIKNFGEFVQRAPEKTRGMDKALKDVTIEERLARFRATQAIGDTENPYRAMAQEELANTLWTEYVPVTSRMIVSRRAMKEKWPQLREEIATARTKYLKPTDDVDKPFELTFEGREFIKIHGGYQSGALQRLIQSADRASGKVLLNPEQAAIVAERLSEAVARKIFDPSEVLRPTRATPQVKRAFIPESRRMFTDTMFEGTAVGAKKLFSAAYENIIVPISTKIKGPKPKGMAPPLWADATVEGISNGIAALDNGMLTAFRQTRRQLKAIGAPSEAEDVMYTIFSYTARGGDPMDFTTNPQKAVQMALQADNSATKNRHLLKAMYMILKNHIGAAVIKSGVDEQIFINKFLDSFEVKSMIDRTALREMGKDLPRDFLARDINLQTTLSGQEIFSQARIQGFLDSLPPSMREAEIINPASFETVGLAVPDIETSVIQFIFGRARDKVVERVIRQEIFRGGTGVIGAGRYETLSNRVFLNDAKASVRADQTHPLNNILTEAERTTETVADLDRATDPIDALQEAINNFHAMPKGKEARAEFIAAVTKNILKYGYYSPDEDLYIAFDRYMNQVRSAPGQKPIMDRLRDNLRADYQVREGARQERIAQMGPEGLAQHRADVRAFNEEYAAKQAIREPQQKKIDEWNEANNEFQKEYSAWERRRQQYFEDEGIDLFDPRFDEYDIDFPPPRRPEILNQNPRGFEDLPDIDVDLPPDTFFIQSEGRAVSTIDMPELLDDRRSPSNLFMNFDENKVMGRVAQSQNIFDEMVFQLTYNEPFAIVQNLQTRGLAAGYLTAEEFMENVQSILMRVGPDSFAVTDTNTAQLLRQLQDDFGALALKDNRSGFSANFYEARRKQPFIVGQMLADLNMLTSGLRRNIVSGQLAGKYLPNFPYQTENILTAPLIASVTAPEYIGTVMRQGLATGAGGISEGARAILGSRIDTITTLRTTPNRLIQDMIALGKGDDVWFTTRLGEPITYRRAQQLLLENNTGRSQAALQLGDTLVNDVKVAARTAIAHIPTGLPKTGRNKYIQFADALLTGRTPSYAHWANGADQAMREAVFFNALKSGIDTPSASVLARNVVLDYGSVPVAMRKFLGGLFLYTSFMYKMTSEVMSSFFRAGKSVRDSSKLQFLTGTPVQNLTRAAVWKKYVHNNTGEWFFLNDTSKGTLWSSYLGEYDNTDAYMVGLRDPVISQVIMVGDFMDYVYQLTGAVGLTDAYQDQPIAQRTLNGLLDTLYSPTIDLLMQVRDVRAGQRVPAKFVQMWKAMGVFDQVMTLCDIEVVRDPKKQRAGEPLFEGSVQYRFRTQAGAANYTNLQYILQVSAAGRIGNDITGMLIAMDIVPEGTEFFRYSADSPLPEGVPERDSKGNRLLDGAAYMLIRNRPVRVPKEWEAKDRVLMKNKAKLELKGKRGR